MKIQNSSIKIRARVRLIGFLIASLITPLSGPAKAQTIIDIATNANDPSNLADKEPSIAVNPTNPLEIAILAFSENYGGTTLGPIWKSRDGGLTWRKFLQIPQPAGGAGGSNDQKIAYDSNGRIYVVELDFGGQSFIYRQTAGPDDPLTPGAGFGDDQPHLDVDNRTVGPCPIQVYSPWLNTSGTNRSNVVTSSTRGATVTSVLVGSAAFNNRTTRSAIDPASRAYIVYKTREGAVDGRFENAHFRVERSDNCGVTWNALGATGVSVHGAAAVVTWFTDTNSSLANGFGNFAKGKVNRARSSDAWIAVDPNSGDVYVVYCNRDASGFGQIYVARSTTQGSTWSAPVRVTDGTHHSAFPEIAVAGTGAVGVLYVDYDDAGANTIFRHRFARSFDTGATWNDKNLQSMDPGPLANALSPQIWGDYEGLTALGNTFYGVFTGESIGRTPKQLDPIFFTASAVPPAHIQVPADVAFGSVCAGSTGRATLNVCCTGSPSLSVSGITSSNPRFAITTPSGGFPVVISPGACFPFEVTFTPTGSGPQTATLTIASDDAAHPTVTVQATAQGGAGLPGLSANQRFSPTVIQSLGPCPSARRFVVSNNGTCSLTITDVAIGGANASDFSLSGLPALPITIEPGDVLGSNALNVVFAPTAVARERTADITVTFVSNPTTGTTSSQTRQLCGEGVRTGARVLVTQGGVPMAQVHEIELKRFWKLFGFTREVDEAKNVALQTVTATPGSACANFQFHREWGGISNPEQLAPGVYKLKVEVKIAGHEVSKTIWFNVDTCGFNGTIVVDF